MEVLWAIAYIVVVSFTNYAMNTRTGLQLSLAINLATVTMGGLCLLLLPTKAPLIIPVAMIIGILDILLYLSNWTSTKQLLKSKTSMHGAVLGWLLVLWYLGAV